MLLWTLWTTSDAGQKATDCTTILQIGNDFQVLFNSTLKENQSGSNEREHFSIMPEISIRAC
jgi:hypothetical protein